MIKILGPGQRLQAGQWRADETLRCRVRMQRDGNLVVSDGRLVVGVPMRQVAGRVVEVHETWSSPGINPQLADQRGVIPGTLSIDIEEGGNPQPCL